MDNRIKFWENTIFPKLYDQYWYHFSYLFSENKFCDVGNDNTEGQGPCWEAEYGNEIKQGKE